MENLRIAVVEDEPSASDLLYGYLGRYSEEAQVGFQISRYYNATSFFEQFKGNFDIVFMDIELPDANGLDAVKKLRETDKDVLVVFVTNMAQFAVKGYEVQAFDFIVKPVSYYNFSVKLKNAIAAYNMKKDKTVWISNREGKRRINVSHIYYVEIVQHMLIYHTSDGTFNASGSLHTLEDELKGADFSLCNRCYLVNLRHVSAISQYTVTVGGVELQISRMKKSSFMRDLNNYLAGGG